MKSYTLGLLVALFSATGLLAADLDSAFQALQAAEKTGDAAQLKKSALQVYTGAHEVIAAPEPASTEDQTVWKSRVEYAEYVQSYTDYAVYSAALKAPAATAVDLLAMLDQHSPKSKYLDSGGYALYFLSLEKTGAKAGILAVAEKAVTRFPNNPDVLLVLSENEMTRKQNDAATKYAKRLIAAASARAKSEGETRANSFLGRGYWIAGVSEAERNDYLAADKDLRAALPLVQGNDTATAAALFHLGVVNYQLGKLLLNRNQVMEAERFSERAAAMKTSYSDQAWTNAQLMKADLAKWR